MMIDLPATDLYPPPYEYVQHYDNYLQDGAWNTPLIDSSSPIGVGKHFIPIMKDETQPWREQKRYAIILDDYQLSIEFSDGKEIASFEKSNDDVFENTITFVDRLNPLREQLALSITQMSELLGVTRKSIYDWYDGSEPRSNIVTRLEVLTRALQTVSDDVDLTRLKVVWNIPVSGKSFREVYGNIDLDDADLLKGLVIKLNELKPNMVKKTKPLRKQTAQVGGAHLIELDKHADFS